MKKYIGKKKIEAEPMIMGEAYEKSLLQAGRVPNESEKNNPGYHVKYENGYESWSPAEPFEKAYKVADTPLDRMVIEQIELEDRITKLDVFTGSDRFKELDDTIQILLVAQLQLMKDYNDVLCTRMSAMARETAHYYDRGGFSFGVALSLLEEGLCLRRAGWNGKDLFVCKQVPAHITSDIIPKMQSLPKAAKDRILGVKGFVDYTSQCLIYNCNTGRADSWVPSVSDIFADDWEVVE